MKYIYKILVLLILFAYQTTFAQKVVKYVITGRSMSGPDCDPTFGGNSDYGMSFGDVLGSLDDDCRRDNDVNSWSQTGMSHTLYQKTIYCPSQWSGSFTYDVRSTEDDGGSCCGALDYLNTVAVACCYRYSLSPSLPPVNTANNTNYGANTATNTWNDCGAVTNTISAKWDISGSWFSNQNSSTGALLNPNCANAIFIDLSTVATNNTWNQKLVNQAKACGDIWYYFDVTQDLDFLDIDTYNDDGDVDVYYENCSCPISSSLAVTYDYYLNDLPRGRYYMKLSGGGNLMAVDFRKGGIVSRPANDNYCAADASATYDFGTVLQGAFPNKAGTTIAATTQDFGSCVDEPRVTTGSWWPPTIADRSVWYKFRTPTTFGTTFPGNYTLTVDGSGNGDDITPILNVYKLASNASSNSACGSVGFNFQNLTFITEINSFTGLATDIEGSFCPEPNTSYYLQVTGYDINEQGNFILTVDARAPGNDVICNIATPITTYDIGTSTSVGNAVGTVTNLNKAGTNIKGSTCKDPNPTWGGVCAAAFNNDNDYGVWFKLPTATNRKDILIKGVTSGDITDLQYALYEAPNATQITNCDGTGMSLISNSYYGNLAWNSVAGLCASADEDHIFTCLDPTKEYYLMVDGNDQIISCGTGNFTLNTYYPREGGVLPCSAEAINPAVMLPNWTGNYKIDLAANFCGTPGGHASAPGAPWTYEKPVWWKFVAPASGSVEIRMKSDSTNLGDELRPKLWVFKENTPGTCSNTALNTTDLDQKDPDDIISVGDPDILTEILDVRCLVPGRTYYLVTDGNNTIAEVCGAGTKVGFFSLEIKDLGQPTRKNDSICGATPGRVPLDPYYFIPTASWKTVNKEEELTKTNHDNYCFDIQNEPSASNWGGTWATSNNARGGWYSFTAPPSGKVEIELNNRSLISDQIDAQIAVYKIKPGYTCNQVQTHPTINVPATSPLEFLGSSNDSYLGIAADEDLTVTCLNPDSLYYIYIEGINSGFPGDLATGAFDLRIRSYPQDPAANNDSKCSPIYLGQPANATLGAGNTGCIFTQSSNFNRSSAILSTATPGGDPTLGVNGVTLIKARGNSGSTVTISSPPGGSEATLGCTPNAGCIDDVFADAFIPIVQDYDRHLYPFNNFCATNSNDSLPSTWGSFFGLANGTPNKSVWFMFKAPADLNLDGEETVLIQANQEIISVNPNKDGLDLRIAVYESSDNTCNGNFYEIASNYDIGNFDEDLKVPCLEPNRFYWIMIDGSPTNDEGYFGMKISRVTPDPRPANDYICNAYTFNNSFFTGDAISRTKDTNICARITRTSIDPTPENDPFGFDLDHTVWYKFTAPVTGVPVSGAFAVQVDVNGWGPFPFGYSDKMDPQIAIFESQDNSCNWGTNGTNMVEIASEYDIFPFAESMKAYCIIPGKTYYVMVDGSALNDQGYFDITINDITSITIPTNDDLSVASTLTFPTNIGSGNSTTSTLSHNYCTDIQSGELDSWTLYDIDNTVWWKFQVPNSGVYLNQHVDVQVRLRSDPSILGVTKNDNINLLGAVYHQIAGTAGSPGNTFSNINEEIGTGTNIAIYSEDINLTCLKPGDWYFLQIDGYSGPFNIFRAQGQGWYDVQLEVTALTANLGNDSVCGAITIPVTNVLQPTSGTFNNICKTTQVNENLPWINADNKTVWFKFQPPATGNITIDLQSQSGDNIGAQIAVYQSQILVASSTCPPIDQLVLVGKEYDALAAGETMTVKCLDNQFWHYIQVNSENIGIWNEGTFKIKIQDIGGTTNPAYNDNICNAKDFGNITNALGTGAFSIVGDSNKCASIQLNEPNTILNPTSSIQKSVWYKFTAPTSGRAKITLHDQDGFLSGIDPEMKLYQGTISGCPSTTPTFSGFTELESVYNPLPNFPSSTTGDEVIEYECLTPGTAYYIQVDGTTVGGPQGYFDIKIEDMIPNYASSPKKPANDEPTALSGSYILNVYDEQCPVPIGVLSEGDELQGSGSWYTGNYKKPSITKKDVLGACNTTDNCGDVWYKFTMPSDACMLGSVVAIQGYSDQVAVGSTYHNDLKVFAYRGTPGSLTPIDCGNTDDNAFTPDYFHFEIAGTAGETIYLQVFDQNFNDTDNDDEEDFFLCVSKRFGLDKCSNINSVPLMEYEKDYCWNLEGASSETPSTAYGESNSGANPTENSCYFKFKMTSSPCDSLKITIKQPTPPNQFLQGGGFNSNQIVTMSIYREDNVLCDGVIDAALVSRSYTCSSPTAILDEVSFNVGVSNLDTNKVYVVQIDGQGQSETGYINNGTIRIDTIQRCVNVQAVTIDDTSTGYWKCTDGWRYYHDRNNVIIFSMFPNGNTVDGIAKIRYKTEFDSSTSCASKMAEYSMRRIWDFNITSGSINPSNPVKVRFYYIASEKAAIISAASTFKGICGGFDEAFEWFKTASGIQYIPTKPTQINPGRIIAGYSETGCLGSDLFGSPQGCFNLTALDNQISCNGTLYVELGAIVGFSGGSGAVGVGPWANSSPLPVELTSFTGYNSGSKNVLNWSTASEFNTLKFEVERSYKSINGIFTYIGMLPAAGNSNTTLSYNLDDINPLAGNNYYRLKMIDIDGTFKYSQTILINNDKDVVYANSINGIYPNPTNHLINIDYQSIFNSTISIKIVNVIGQEIKNVNKSTIKGNQLIQIDVSNFANGVYIINIQDANNGKILQSKFIKD